MPVKIDSEVCKVSQTFPKDIDILVKEVRERLCLKSNEKLTKCYRSTPYSIPKSSSCRGVGNVPKGTCLKCSRVNVKRNDWKRSDIHCSCEDKSQTDNPHKLLEKLLREQTLIQEAVRRIKTSVKRDNIFEKSQLCDNSSSSTSTFSSNNSSCSYEGSSSTLVL